MSVLFNFLATYELPEFALVRELVYVFQGIEGRYIKYDASADQFKVDSQVCNIQLEISIRNILNCTMC